MRLRLVNSFIPLFSGIENAFTDVDCSPLPTLSVASLRAACLGWVFRGRAPIPITVEHDEPGKLPLFPTAEVWETKLCEYKDHWITPDELPPHIARVGYGQLNRLLIVDVFLNPSGRGWDRSGVLIIPSRLAREVSIYGDNPVPAALTKGYATLDDMHRSPFRLCQGFA